METPETSRTEVLRSDTSRRFRSGQQPPNSGFVASLEI